MRYSTASCYVWVHQFSTNHLHPCQSLDLLVNRTTSVEASYHLSDTKSFHTSPCDFRPISITSVRSRTIEQYLYPAFFTFPQSLTLSDQYAFRPTGSTTDALIAIFQIVTNLITCNPYVVVIALDFSKAFDTVRHLTLLHKMAQLDLPDTVYYWLVNFFKDHQHCTK